MRGFVWIPAAALALSTALCGAACGQAYNSGGLDSSPGITVFGTGDVRARPNVIEVQLRSAAKAEMTGDAIVKYRDAKRRTLEAFAGLKMGNVEIEELGLSIAPGNSAEMMQNMMRGMPVAPGKTQIELASTLLVRLKGIETMTPEKMTETVGKLLDVAQDSGANVGPSPEEANMAYRYGRMLQGGFVRFVLTDVSKIREQAYEKAVEDARARATRLAKLNDVQLGTVLSVQEIQVSGEEPRTATQPWEVVSTTATSKSSQISSDSLSDIPFRVKLLVRFSIKPSDAKSASVGPPAKLDAPATADAPAP
jgi:uncharacterized protein